MPCFRFTVLPDMSRHLAVALLLHLAFLAAANIARAADSDLTFTHLAGDQFPTLKSKAFNSNFALDGAAGNAVMRSRYGSDTGPDGEKVFIYGYQLDLKNTYVLSGKPGAGAVTLDLSAMPPLAVASKLPDKASLYVIDETGSDAGVAVQSVSQQNGKLTFTFATPVRAGNQPGTGDHSVWFGLISSWHPQHGHVLIGSAGGQAQPPAAPSLAAGAKPAAPATSQAATSGDAGNPGIQVFVPAPDQPKPDKNQPAPAAN